MLATFIVPATLATSVTPAVATGTNDGGGGTDDGTAGSGSDSSLKCKPNNGLYRGNTRVYESRYSNCVGKSKTTKQLRCEIGTLVFNMWGTGTNPSAGGAVTRINNPNTCTNNPYKYRIWANSPAIAGAGPVAPWASPTGTLINGGSAVSKATQQPAYIHSPHITDTAKKVNFASGKTAEGQPLASGSTTISNGTWGAPCTAVAGTNVLATTYNQLSSVDYGTPAQREQTLANFRYQVATAAKAKQQSGSQQKDMDITDELGLNYTYAYNTIQAGQTYGAGGPQPAGTVATYNDGWAVKGGVITGSAFPAVFDTNTCASNLNFVSTINPLAAPGANPAAIKLRGACWIPIWRVGRDWVGKNDASNADWATIDNKDWKFGERFNANWRNNGEAAVYKKVCTTTGKGKKKKKTCKQVLVKAAVASTATQSWNSAQDALLNEGRVPGLTSRGLIDSWRASIRAWYVSTAQANKKATGNAYWKGGGDGEQTLPAGAYKKTGNSWKGAQTMTIADGADDLANGVKCITASGSTMSMTPTTVMPTAANLSLHLKLTTPSALYAGGVRSPAVYKVEPNTSNPAWVSGLSCNLTNGDPCKTGDYGFRSADSWNAPLSVNAVTEKAPFASLTNFKRGSNANDLDGSYTQKSLPATWYANNPQELQFYRATPQTPKSGIRAVVSTPTGKGSVQVKEQATPGLIIRDPNSSDPNQVLLRIDPVIVDVWKSQTFHKTYVSINGAPEKEFKDVTATEWPIKPVSSGVLKP